MCNPYMRMHTAHTHMYAKEVTDDFIKRRLGLGIQLSGRAFSWSGLHLQHRVRGEKEREEKQAHWKEDAKIWICIYKPRPGRNPSFSWTTPTGALILKSSLQNHNKIYFCCVSHPVSSSAIATLASWYRQQDQGESCSIYPSPAVPLRLFRSKSQTFIYFPW